MRDYGVIRTTIWHSKKFRSLEGDDARLLYFYLHSCPHSNRLGCYVLPMGYAIHDLQWSEERVRNGFETLSKRYLIGFDGGETVVRIVDFLKHDPPANQNHVIGIFKATSAVPSCEEKLKALNDLAESKHAKHAAELHAEIETLSKRFGNGVETKTQPKPSPSPNPAQPSKQAETSEQAAAPETAAAESWKAVDYIDEIVPTICRLWAKATWSFKGKTPETCRWLAEQGVSPEQFVAIAEPVLARMAENGERPPSSLNYLQGPVREALESGNVTPDEPKVDDEKFFENIRRARKMGITPTMTPEQEERLRRIEEQRGEAA